ncbi:cell division protein SepF [Geodermatophilus sabuli]|uniref:Cell division protein SepF n=1 Tax=Geodermatophilus sabuli TaxID=1564158 RepID=A0A7K3W150_9ACTN|nr:cell division protein SepF [Geodermatophilus sabuli]NEK58585.1 cell division protein SepF [Geodermatophilus sabuli]
MAGAMRKMGIYLGLVEDDDARAYGRYDARQTEYADRHDRLDDRRYGRYAPDDAYDDHYGEPVDRYADAGYRADDYAEDLEADLPPAPDPEPVALPRRTGPGRTIGLAPAAAGPPRVGGLAGVGASAGGSSGGSSASGAAGLAVREPVAVAAPEPEPAPAPAPKPYRITTLHPRTYNEARQIGESFRDGMPVIMNLSEMDDADAKRLVDFAAGLSFGLRGSIERVTNKVFLLSPRDVDVTAEDKARIREGGFFNQS